MVFSFAHNLILKYNSPIVYVMLNLTYILYSPSLDRYYVGSTRHDMDERLRRHNSNHKGYTGKVNDWRIVLVEEFPTYEAAHKREREIKAWKSRKMIEKLIGL